MRRRHYEAFGLVLVSLVCLGIAGRVIRSVSLWAGLLVYGLSATLLGFGSKRLLEADDEEADDESE